MAELVSMRLPGIPRWIADVTFAPVSSTDGRNVLVVQGKLRIKRRRALVALCALRRLRP